MRGGWIAFQALLWVSLGLIAIENQGRAGEWSLPDSRMGVRTAPILLLTRPDIRADLKLDAKQIAEAQRTIEELTRRATALRGKSGPAVVAERRAIDEAQTQWLGTNLSGHQLDRLRQIDLQWEGPSAMISRPLVAEYIKLTSEQRSTMAQAISERNSLRARGTFSLREDQILYGRILSVLNESQKQLWTSLLGEPCRFTLASTAPRTRDEATQRANHSQKQKVR